MQDHQQAYQTIINKTSENYKLALKLNIPGNSYTYEDSGNECKIKAREYNVANFTRV